MFIYLMIYALIAVDLTWFNSCWSTPSLFCLPKSPNPTSFSDKASFLKKITPNPKFQGVPGPNSPIIPKKITFPFLSEKKTPVNCPTPWQNLEGTQPASGSPRPGDLMAKVGWISISHASPWHAMANSPGISPLKHGVKSPMGSSPAHPMGLSAMSGTFGDIFLFNGMELGYDWELQGIWPKRKGYSYSIGISWGLFMRGM